MPVLDDSSSEDSSIQIEASAPNFLLNWEITNVIAFVEVANNQPAANAPSWMQTLPPNITAETFTDDLVSELTRVAGGRCGDVMLLPNTLAQFGAIFAVLMAIQENTFMQNVGQIALPVINGNERHLATTYTLPETQRATLNTFPRPPAAGLRLFL